MGTNYHGSQIQQNANTVQAVFQSALQAVLGCASDIKCCSRTDAGVHANRFCISFQTQKRIKPDNILMALNTNLPGDIRVIDCVQVPDAFHARYSASGKRYVYKVYNARVLDPFWVGRAAQFLPDINEKELNDVAQVFVGAHDFRAFCAKKTAVSDTTRTVSAFTVERQDDIVLFSVTADGFLYNMARAMIGTLLNVARCKLTRDGIAQRLASGVRDNLVATAPAAGLYLDEVFYPAHAFIEP